MSPERFVKGESERTLNHALTHRFANRALASLNHPTTRIVVKT